MILMSYVNRPVRSAKIVPAVSLLVMPHRQIGVQAIVGHASPAMTRHYTHLGVESLRSAVESIPSCGAVTVKALPMPAADDGRLQAAKARLAQAAEIVAAASTADIAPGSAGGAAGCFAVSGGLPIGAFCSAISYEALAVRGSMLWE